MNPSVMCLLLASSLCAADPTFLRRTVADVQPHPDDLTAGAKAAAYRPLFGVGDSQATQLKGIARHGELTVGPDGSTTTVSYPAEEGIDYILDGDGALPFDEQK